MPIIPQLQKNEMRQTENTQQNGKPKFMWIITLSVN